MPPTDRPRLAMVAGEASGDLLGGLLLDGLQQQRLGFVGAVELYQGAGEIAQSVSDRWVRVRISLPPVWKDADLR